MWRRYIVVRVHFPRYFSSQFGQICRVVPHIILWLQHYVLSSVQFQDHGGPSSSNCTLRTRAVRIVGLLYVNATLAPWTCQWLTWASLSWELFCSSGYEWDIIRGERKFKWPMVSSSSSYFYFMSSTLQDLLFFESICIGRLLGVGVGLLDVLIHFYSSHGLLGWASQPRRG